MSLANPDIASLLGSRICHDLISPLGAISNGVELLTMTGESVGPEIALISESIENANARIRFFRVAFGAASEGQMCSASEIRSILADLGKGLRMKINWLPTEDVPRREAKLAFLMLQCLETAMPWGGEIEVSRANERWTLIGSSDRMKINARLWEALSLPDGGSAISAAEVQFLLVPLLIREAGRQLTLELSETRIAARF